MAPKYLKEAVALQVLIEANVRLLFPDVPLHIITAKCEDEQIYACVVQVYEIDGKKQHQILLQGEPGHSHWGFKSSLESIFRKSQALLGKELNLIALEESDSKY
ncbi:hypothetical protein BKA67DRAFT_580467 [Truncatella angustata]|uniref:Uncharacterized protein n=1 Tax=Truncatella angustata TaxID=152316 RepID=A0A9P8RJ17_9PEZI|nr:uncharacterized protein BKA67DRAFT_580467 [Truncatella angustata]KAH6646754.1 hypothetical protein BKA67DRAFT_580467 [Truncatella angustata]